MNGWRCIFISFVVKMFTTAGMARLAASLKDETLRTSGSGGASRIVTTLPRPLHARRSGRSVMTTKSAATHTVAVWQNVSQSLRIIGEEAAASSARMLFSAGTREADATKRAG